MPAPGSENIDQISHMLVGSVFQKIIPLMLLAFVAGLALKFMKGAFNKPQQRAVRSSNFSSPTCPHCGSDMIRRTARKGPHAGNKFWGCSQYPKCKGIIN